VVSIAISAKAFAIDRKPLGVMFCPSWGPRPRNRG
jgi:hypothetical protein